MSMKTKKVRDDQTIALTAGISLLASAVEGINADVSGAYERCAPVAHADAASRKADEAYQESLGDYVQWLFDQGFTSRQFLQAKPADYAGGKEDPAYKSHRAFYDGFKISYAGNLESANDYGDVPLMPLYHTPKKQIEEKHGKRTAIALADLKDDANQGVRNIRERLITLEKRDENGDPIIKTEAERDAANLFAIYKRRMADEDMPADELKSKIANLQNTAVEQECELEYIALISEI